MKKLIACLAFANCLLLTDNLFSQTPQAIPYQAVARDNAGNLIANQNISLRFSIHDSSAVGTVVYEFSETFPKHFDF